MEPVFCDNCGDRIWRQAFDLPIPIGDKPNRVICNKCIQELYQISVEVTGSDVEEELNSEDGTKEEEITEEK